MKQNRSEYALYAMEALHFEVALLTLIPKQKKSTISYKDCFAIMCIFECRTKPVSDF
jgi:hypothetical protein